MASTSSLPSFSSTFADVPHNRERDRAEYEDVATRERKRRHTEPAIKEEEDELEPSPPPPAAPTQNKRRRLSPGEKTQSEAASVLEAMRNKVPPPPLVDTAMTMAATDPAVLPPLTSFSTRRRQSQNSAGADKAAKLSIRPPPSPYQNSLGSAEYNKSMQPAIHSAPPAGYAMRQDQQQSHQPRQQQQLQQQPGGGLRLPVVPPVLGARPGMPDTPRTAVPLSSTAAARRTMLHSPSPAARVPRTAGLPMAPPPRPGGGYVQPIATARPALGGSGSGFSGLGQDREKQAFLAPFESFYDTLADARRLKGWLADQLQRASAAQPQQDARITALEREVDALRRRVVELEAERDPLSVPVPVDDSAARTHAHTSAVRLEPARSAASESSPVVVHANINGTPSTPVAGLSPPLRMVGPRISSPLAPTHAAAAVASTSRTSSPNGIRKPRAIDSPARVASR